MTKEDLHRKDDFSVIFPMSSSYARHCAVRRILNFHRIGLIRGSMSQKLPFSINICFNIKHLIVQICSFSWICILNSEYFLINLFISVLLTSSKYVFLHFTVRHSFMFVFMNAYLNQPVRKISCRRNKKDDICKFQVWLSLGQLWNTKHQIHGVL